MHVDPLITIAEYDAMLTTAEEDLAAERLHSGRHVVPAVVWSPKRTRRRANLHKGHAHHHDDGGGGARSSSKVHVSQPEGGILELWLPASKVWSKSITVLTSPSAGTWYLSIFEPDGGADRRQQLRLNEAPRLITAAKLPTDARSFSITKAWSASSADGEEGYGYIFRCSTRADRNRWVDSVRAAVEEARTLEMVDEVAESIAAARADAFERSMQLLDEEEEATSLREAEEEARLLEIQQQREEKELERSKALASAFDESSTSASEDAAARPWAARAGPSVHVSRRGSVTVYTPSQQQPLDHLGRSVTPHAAEEGARARRLYAERTEVAARTLELRRRNDEVCAQMHDPYARRGASEEVLAAADRQEYAARQISEGKQGGGRVGVMGADGVFHAFGDAFPPLPEKLDEEDAAEVSEVGHASRYREEEDAPPRSGRVEIRSDHGVDERESMPHSSSEVNEVVMTASPSDASLQPGADATLALRDEFSNASRAQASPLPPPPLSAAQRGSVRAPASSNNVAAAVWQQRRLDATQIDGLEEGWVTMRDARSGRRFYHDTRSGVTHWERPPALQRGATFSPEPPKFDDGRRGDVNEMVRAWEDGRVASSSSAPPVVLAESSSQQRRRNDHLTLSPLRGAEVFALKRSGQAAMLPLAQTSHHDRQGQVQDEQQQHDAEFGTFSDAAPSAPPARALAPKHGVCDSVANPPPSLEEGELRDDSDGDAPPGVQSRSRNVTPLASPRHPQANQPQAAALPTMPPPGSHSTTARAPPHAQHSQDSRRGALAARTPQSHSPRLPAATKTSTAGAAREGTNTARPEKPTFAPPQAPNASLAPVAEVAQPEQQRGNNPWSNVVGSSAAAPASPALVVPDTRAGPSSTLSVPAGQGGSAHLPPASALARALAPEPVQLPGPAQMPAPAGPAAGGLTAAPVLALAPVPASGLEPAPASTPLVVVQKPTASPASNSTETAVAQATTADSLPTVFNNLEVPTEPPTALPRTLDQIDASVPAQEGALPPSSTTSSTPDLERSVVEHLSIAVDTSQPLGFGINNLADGKHGLSSVKEGSQAERLGLRVGDTLISIGGDTLTNVHSMDMVTSHLRTAIVNAKAEGQPLKIIIERGTHEATPPPAPTQTVATPAAASEPPPSAGAVPPKAATVVADGQDSPPGIASIPEPTVEAPVQADGGTAAAAAAAAAAESGKEGGDAEEGAADTGGISESEKVLLVSRILDRMKNPNTALAFIRWREKVQVAIQVEQLGRLGRKVPQELRIVAGELRLGDKRRLKTPKSYPVKTIKSVRWFAQPTAGEKKARKRSSSIFGKRKSRGAIKIPAPPPPGALTVKNAAVAGERCDLEITFFASAKEQKEAEKRHGEGTVALGAAAKKTRRRSSLLLGKSAPVLRLRTQTAAHASVVIAELRRLSEVIVVDAQPAEGGQDGANQGVDSVDEALKSSEDS